ncbi:MAG TPA: DoxX family protein [Edaphobacter sp.]|nr:DoxX family protein [Edaphobacter sp.]
MLNKTPYIGAVGRILIAALFLISGLGKIAAPAMMQGIIAGAGLPFPLLALLVAIVIEVVGGILLILGYQSRIVASVMAVFTVAAALGFHRNFADQNAMAHFLKNISITGGLLQIAAFGAGSFSIDSCVAKSDMTRQGLAVDKHYQRRANI